MVLRLPLLQSLFTFVQHLLDFRSITGVGLTSLVLPSRFWTAAQVAELALEAPVAHSTFVAGSVDPLIKESKVRRCSSTVLKQTR